MLERQWKLPSSQYSFLEETKRLADFEDDQREVSILSDIETFTYAFKLGAKIMLDVLTDSPIREI